MKISVGLGKSDAEERLEKRGVTRRQFMQFCTAVAVAMGMGPGYASEVAAAMTKKRRPSVIYLHNAECTGCSEAVLRTVDPYFDELILDVISLDYHETVMAAAGHAAEAALEEAMHSPDGYVCVIEGAIPMGKGGIYGQIGGRTMYDICAEVAPGALATIAIGACATFGGIQAAKPNPTNAQSANQALGSLGVNAINVAGCPPNPINFVGTVVHLLTKGMPELDENNRPTMFYGETVHDRCERLKHFEMGEFAMSFNSEEARKGWCLYMLGCKGPSTFNNCPQVLFNQQSWPVQAGHPCIGCSEPDFWDAMTPFYEPM
jgi:[NiFe] hydrogenase small subunit